MCDATHLWDEEAKERIPLVTFQLTPDQLDALGALLDLVHYDDLANQWRAMLPASLTSRSVGGA